MLKKASALIAVTLLAACGTAGPGATLKSGSNISNFPTKAECRAAQLAVGRDSATRHTWNGIGQTTWVGDTCMLDVTFATGRDMLNFVDGRIAAGKDPTAEVGHSHGQAGRVMMLLEVTGQIQAQSSDQVLGQAPGVRATTMAQTNALKTQLEHQLGDLFGLDVVNGSGITQAQGGFALNLTFVTAKGVRTYVARAVAQGVSPAPFYGKAAGHALYVPLVMSVVGPITIQPAVTVGN